MNEFLNALDFMESGLTELFTRFFPFIGFGLSIIFIIFMSFFLERLRKKGEEDV